MIRERDRRELERDGIRIVLTREEIEFRRGNRVVTFTRQEFEQFRAEMNRQKLGWKKAVRILLGVPVRMSRESLERYKRGLRLAYFRIRFSSRSTRRHFLRTITGYQRATYGFIVSVCQHIFSRWGCAHRLDTVTIFWPRRSRPDTIERKMRELLGDDPVVVPPEAEFETRLVRREERAVNDLDSLIRDQLSEWFDRTKEHSSQHWTTYVIRALSIKVPRRGQVFTQINPAENEREVLREQARDCAYQCSDWEVSD